MKMINKVLATVGLVVALGTATVVTNKTHELPVTAATEQTHRRVYAFLQYGKGWDSSDIYIHYWNDPENPMTDWNNSPKMNLAVGDYHLGLFYYDVPVEATDLLFKDWAGVPSKKSNQTADVVIADLFTAPNYLVAQIEGWVADVTPRAVTPTTAPMSSEQFAGGILSRIDSCSTSYASGFNAYPQLKAAFYDASEIDDNVTFDENVGGKATGLTIGTKMAMLEANYNADQGIAGLNPYALPATFDKGLIIFMGIGLLSLTGFYIFKKTRKNIA